MIKLSASNIAWTSEQDIEMYIYLSKSGFQGIEIAPTRLFADQPYKHIDDAISFTKMLYDKYNLQISSMQSIWYGRSERLFGTAQEYATLLDYTKQAILFATALKCSNLVFGCPQNRSLPDGADVTRALSFFYELGQFAWEKGTVLSLEPNPTIYGTNFVNRTEEAFQMAREVNSKGFKVNVDLGTMIYQNENIELLNDNFELIHHVHISEPFLVAPTHEEFYYSVLKLLKERKYEHFASIEMKNTFGIMEVKKTIDSVKSLE